jgi:uncharacterized protein YndB with AHSA1/START domain
MEPTSIERTIWIAASRERVWDAITDPEQVEQWFSPGTRWELSTMGVGGRLFVRNPETGAEMYTQIIAVFDPPARLVTRSLPNPPDTEHVTAYTLEEEDGGTRLTMVYSFEGMPEEKRRTFNQQSGTGFTLMLGNIKGFIEGTPLPMPGGF